MGCESPSQQYLHLLVISGLSNTCQILVSELRGRHLLLHAPPGAALVLVPSPANNLKLTQNQGVTLRDFVPMYIQHLKSAIGHRYRSRYEGMRDDEVLLLLQYDSAPEVPMRPLTGKLKQPAVAGDVEVYLLYIFDNGGWLANPALEEAEGGRGFIPPPHTAVDLPGTEGLRKRLSLDVRMVCLLPQGDTGGEAAVRL